ncbi:hypothetical protein [Streptomyces mangrovisoli]|uniref:Uncharacterized protein n=1 Tax=Streptomyces mangrovisoli TaxID=1428628 RepID=A0A1J4NKR6_9ACTN|nr:hypothetical protein [Streptomyces mangrovisoli]OIJ62754.1 hypothetical protein WN71_037730 [Streptomyces mangrovisoli]
MARRTGVWLWRWRRNPLRRRSDVVEGWIVAVACLLALAGAVFAGMLTAGAMEHSFDRARTESHAVSAVIAKDAAKRSAQSASGAVVWASVNWTDTHGTAHNGRVEVPAAAAPGSHVTVWTDAHGNLTAKPSSPGDAAIQSALGGVWSAAATIAVVFGLARIARARLDHRRMQQWAEEWATVGTRWGRKTG